MWKTWATGRPPARIRRSSSTNSLPFFSKTRPRRRPACRERLAEPGGAQSAGSRCPRESRGRARTLSDRALFGLVEVEGRMHEGVATAVERQSRRETLPSHSAAARLVVPIDRRAQRRPSGEVRRAAPGAARRAAARSDTSGSGEPAAAMGSVAVASEQSAPDPSTR